MFKTLDNVTKENLIVLGVALLALLIRLWAAAISPAAAASVGEPSTAIISACLTLITARRLQQASQGSGSGS